MNELNQQETRDERKGGVGFISVIVAIGMMLFVIATASCLWTEKSSAKESFVANKK